MAERKKKVRTRLSWADVDPKVVLAVANLCDGHTIFAARVFTEIGAPPAIISAVCDALGVAPIDMPITPEAVWRALRSKQAA